MKSSTWSDTNQHWIPQFLLKGFGIKKRSSSLYEMDKQTGNIRTCNVEDAASKPRLLTERDDELMKTIESRAARVIGKIRKGNLELRQEDRQSLDSLVFAMMRNDPHSGIDRARIREETVQSVSMEFEGAIGRHGGSIDPQILRDFVDGHSNHDYLNMAVQNKDSLILRAFGKMGLQARQPENGEFFVIGDSPVLAVRGTVDGVRSLLNPGSQVILPIQSRHVLIYSWVTPTNLIQLGDVLDRKQVRSLNRDYFLGTNCRYIYGRDTQSLKRARMPRIKMPDRSRSTRVNDGWRTMRSEVEKIAASRAIRDAEMGKTRDSVAHQLVEKARVESQGRSRQDY